MFLRGHVQNCHMLCHMCERVRDEDKEEIFVVCFQTLLLFLLEVRQVFLRLPFSSLFSVLYRSTACMFELHFCRYPLGLSHPPFRSRSRRHSHTFSSSSSSPHSCFPLFSAKVSFVFLSRVFLVPSLFQNSPTQRKLLGQARRICMCV